MALGRHVELLEALSSALNIEEVLVEAYPLLLDLVPAEYGALGVSSSGKAEDYNWLVANVPEAFFRSYPELAAHDFIRVSVLRAPNQVILDEEMISRREIEANLLYQRAHEVGMPIEHAMAVMLHVDERWQSGLSLYRERGRPFTERERERLRRLTPAIANAVRNCHLYRAAAARGEAFGGLLDEQGAAVVIVTPAGVEVARTSSATWLLDKWFSPVEQAAGKLPQVLLDELARAARAHPLALGAPTIWTRSRGKDGIEVTIVLLPRSLGRDLWAFLLHELPRVVPLPAVWRARLTPREGEVVERVLRGWDNLLIASDLGCAEATVKKHLQSVFDKLGVDNRTTLVANAALLRG